MSRAQEIAVLLRAAHGLIAEALKTLEVSALDGQGRREPTAKRDSVDEHVTPTDLDAMRARRALRGVK